MPTSKATKQIACRCRLKYAGCRTPNGSKLLHYACRASKMLRAGNSINFRIEITTFWHTTCHGRWRWTNKNESSEFCTRLIVYVCASVCVYCTYVSRMPCFVISCGVSDSKCTSGSLRLIWAPFACCCCIGFCHCRLLLTLTLCQFVYVLDIYALLFCLTKEISKSHAKAKEKLDP